MNMKAILSFLLCTAMLATGTLYGQEKKNFTVSLQVDSILSSQEQWVYMRHYEDGVEFVIDDSVLIKPTNTSAILHGYATEQAQIVLVFSVSGPDQVILIVSPNDSIHVNVRHEDGLGFVWIDTTNSPATNENAKRMNKLKIQRQKIFNWSNTLSALSNKDSLERIALTDSIAKMTQEIVDIDIFMAKYSTNPRNAWGALLASDVERIIGRDSLLVLTQMARERFPSSKSLRDLHNPNRIIKKGSEKSAIAQRRIAQIYNNKKGIKIRNNTTGTAKKEVALNIDSQFPDFTLIGINGDTIALSQLRNQKRYILVDFWASWCIPCLKEMGVIKRVLKDYPNDIIICSVSIDRNHDSWKKAIERHQIEEFLHLIATDNDGYLDKVIESFSISQIPRNYLLAPDGTIVAINLYGKELISKVEQLVGK
jgi:thiol-disulfide isomerase/thioredoxin